jgi:hypothetical protein
VIQVEEVLSELKTTREELKTLSGEVYISFIVIE